MPVSGRRTFLAATLALAACPLAGRAQGPEKVRRVGFLANTIALAELDQGTSTNPAFVEFVAGLRKLGWQEGRNIRIVWRSAENQLGRLPQLARELVSASVEVIVAFGPGADAAARATKEIPIVMATYYSPVEAGLARSLAKPGGNVTGILLAAGNEQSIQKRLALLKEAAPGIARIGWLGWNPRKQAQRWVERVKADPAFASAAAHLGVSVFGDSFETAEDVPGAMERAVRRGAQGLVVPDATFLHYREHQERVAREAVRHRIPVMHHVLAAAAGGGLLAFGSDITVNYRRAAHYVDRILRGEKAGDLPIEQPTRVELHVNLQAAKAIGLEVPQTLLLRADRVFE